MMCKKEIVAMILAGGQGTRLGVLTKNLAKPAVPFGGKFRIIDFPLSNCSNSGMDAIGVLTQYKPLQLNSHIGIGDAWDLDSKDAGVTILPPYKGEDDSNWYRGTANAIYQNRVFIESYDPEYVLILSGDHIYKMDYSKMLQFHKDRKADGTIAVIEVPDHEASRFGIMNTREDLSIYEFEEKPKDPKSNLASMGIYIFNWKVLNRYLEEDEKNELSDNDFGKNIIPKMIKDEIRMVAYPFKGYWRDVGTVESLWEANMDILKEDCELNLYNEEWEIYSNNEFSSAQYIGHNSVIRNSLIVGGCSVEGRVFNSILFQGVKIGKNTIITDSVIMPNVNIGDNVRINKAIIDSDAVISGESRIGDGDTIAVIEAREEIDSGSYLEACSTI
jgi:glucose-1-phosphate adenylyltransferase